MKPTIDRDKLRKAARITLRCEPEEIPFVGNCSAVDPEADRETEAWIRAQLASGNEWAWCSVTVTASWNGISEGDSLGACSYESEEDFCAPDGYHPDMIRNAIESLAERLESIATAVELELIAEVAS